MYSRIFKQQGITPIRPAAELRKVRRVLAECTFITEGNQLAGSEIIVEITRRKMTHWNCPVTGITYTIDKHEYAKMLTELTGYTVQFKQGTVRTVRFHGPYVEGKGAWQLILDRLRSNGLHTLGKDTYHGLDFNRVHFTLSPYQILMMSTKKSWTSCADLHGGDYRGTAVTYSQLPFYAVLYFSRRNKIISRVILFYDGRYIGALRIYGSCVHTVILKSVIFKIIEDLEILKTPVPVRRTLFIDDGTIKANYGFHDIFTTAYYEGSVDPEKLIPYQKQTLYYVNNQGLICYFCGNRYIPADPRQLACATCDMSVPKCHVCGTILPDGVLSVLI